MSNTKKTTIIYLTTNVDDEKFENKVRKQLLESAGRMPIISVSRKHIRFGRNISVGKVPLCKSSALKMLLKGLQAAGTENAIIAESNCIYPPEYFSFSPPTNNTLYQYTNVWTLGNNFWKKRFLTGAQACNRKYWISTIKAALEGQKGWKEIDVPTVFKNADRLTWNSESPVVRLITPNTTEKYANLHRRAFPKKSLPFWGQATDLKKKMEA